MKKGIIAVIFLGFVLWVGSAQADMKEMNFYKEAFPGAKIKCGDCHVNALPKKEDGKHELNAYGKAAMDEAAKTGAKVMADTFKKVGKVEDFKK